MINLPFERATFAREMKPKISGNNLTLEYDNIESSLSKVAVQFHGYLSVSLYDKIVKKDNSISSEKCAIALDYLQRSMLHFAIYQHAIYLISKIGNDGITVKKTDDSTTIYKYQQDQLENKLISDAWFWLNQLIAYLNDNENDFPDWKNSDQKKQMSEIQVSLSDFTKWTGVGDISFMIFAAWIIREVWDESVMSRIKEDEFNDCKFKQKIVRAVCYDVMSRACIRLSYFCLPEPIRLDINNEMGKVHNSQEDVYIREKVAKVFETKALAYWNSVDSELSTMESSGTNNNVSTQTYIQKIITENEKFVH